MENNQNNPFFIDFNLCKLFYSNKISKIIIALCQLKEKLSKKFTMSVLNNLFTISKNKELQSTT